MKQMEKILKELGHVTMGSDGSSDGNGNPIEHTLALNGKHHFSLDEMQMHGVTKSAEELEKILIEHKQYLEKLKCEMNGLNRDDESKMSLCGAEYHNVDDIGCPTHVLDLVLKDWPKNNRKCVDAKSESNELSYPTNNQNKTFFKRSRRNTKRR